MITEEKYYGCVCDNCGEAWYDDHDGFAAFSSDDQMREKVMNDEDWYVLEGELIEDYRHYCPKCFTIDDKDNLIIKKIKQ